MKAAERKTSPWLIGFFVLIGIVVLIGGAIFAIDRFSQGTPPTYPSASTPPASTPPTQTPAIKNTDAAKLILTQDDMKSNGWIFDHEGKPLVPGSASTHAVTFTKTGEYFRMEVSTFATDSDAERKYSDSKFNQKDNIIDMIEIGDEGYYIEGGAPMPAPAPAPAQAPAPAPAPPPAPAPSPLGVQLLAPSNGTIGCPTKPASFSWSPFKETTKYKFVLAKDAAMTQVVKEAEVPTTAFEYDGTLDNSTNYFWRVMAIEPPSDWSSTFSFQTEAVPWSPPEASNYSFFFLKHNVVVEIRAIADYEEILSSAKIVEARIQ